MGKLCPDLHTERDWDLWAVRAVGRLGLVSKLLLCAQGLTFHEEEWSLFPYTAPSASVMIWYERYVPKDRRAFERFIYFVTVWLSEMRAECRVQCLTEICERDAT